MNKALLPLLLGLISVQGCAFYLRAYYPSEAKLRVVGQLPLSQYAVRDDEGELYTPDADGRFVIGVKSYRGCDVYFLNLIKIRSVPESEFVIEKGGKRVKKIKAGKMFKLPIDEKSYHVIKLK